MIFINLIMYKISIPDTHKSHHFGPRIFMPHISYCLELILSFIVIVTCHHPHQLWGISPISPKSLNLCIPLKVWISWTSYLTLPKTYFSGHIYCHSSSPQLMWVIRPMRPKSLNLSSTINVNHSDIMTQVFHRNFSLWECWTLQFGRNVIVKIETSIWVLR